MDYQLFIAVNVLEFVERLPRKIRNGIREVLVKIGDNPVGLSDVIEYDSKGRMVHITIVGDYALIYWIDDADRHVKILDIHSADR